MDIQQKAIITLVKSAITGQSYDFPKEFDLNELLAVAKKHNIASMLYYGANNCGISQKENVMQQLFVMTCMYISASQRQIFELRKIYSAFEENQIEYMPLKGTLLKALYPKAEMRVMGDADILIHTSELEKINGLMEKAGFTYLGVSDHEIKWSKKGLYVELHSCLIPSYNKDYYAYFGDGWCLAKKNGDSYKYEMSTEDNFVYLFTHFAKHYRDAGIGIKHIVDLWIYILKNPNINKKYIKVELKKLQLDEFYENIMDTLAVWFEDEPSNPKTDFITRFILNSGAFGKEEVQVLSDALKTSKTVGNAKRVRISKYFHLVFLPYKSMKVKYPVLNKVPVLLPIMWVYRIFDTLFNKKERIKYQNDKVRAMTQENIDNYQTALNFVGLDFNFKE